MEKKLLQEIGDRKDYKVSYFHDDLINQLKEKVEEEISSFDVDKKVFFLEFLEKEIYWANHFKLRFVKQLEDKKKSLKLKKDDKNEEKFNDYKMVKKSYKKAIECLEKYVSCLLEKRRSIIKSRKSKAIKIVQDGLNNQDVIVPETQNLQEALRDAEKEGFIHPYKKKFKCGSLAKLLTFLYKHNNIVLETKDILKLFVQSTGEPYKKSYCVSVLCDIHAIIKKRQNNLHKNS
jgi:hypothetical protein